MKLKKNNPDIYLWKWLLCFYHCQEKEKDVILDEIKLNNML